MANSQKQKNASTWSEAGEKIQRSALGRTAFIGELYDARTEMFCSRLLFSSSLPENFIRTQQSSNSEINSSYTDQLSDRFRVLKIEAELQLPILAKCFSFNLSGSGKYLNEEKSSERIISCSLVYNISTFCEKFIPPFNEIIDYIDETAFKDDQYTHVVVEINWGANCVISLEHHISDSDKNVKAEGDLKGQLKILASLIESKGSGSVEYKDLKTEKFENLKLKMHGDVLPDGKIPNTVESAIEFISKIPEYLKNVNNGKGKPLNYAMIPIDTFKKLRNFEKIITGVLIRIEESFVNDLVSFFQDIAVLKQKLNDLGNDLAEYKKYLPKEYLLRIKEMQQKVDNSEIKFRTDLAKDLPLVRSGKIPTSDLMDKIEIYKSADLNEGKIQKFIKEFKPIRKKVDFISLCLSKNINYLGKDDNLDLIINQNMKHDYMVLCLSEELCSKNPTLYKETLSYFFTGTEEMKDYKDVHFIIMDLDLNKNAPCKLEEVQILNYREGGIHEYDVYKRYRATKEMNDAKLKNSTDIEYVKKKPKDCVALKLVCPGSITGTCSKEALIWKCISCKQYLEYDLDNNFYCSCGKAESHLYKFRCSSFRHGNEFLEIDKNFPLKEELGKLLPLKKTVERKEEIKVEDIRIPAPTAPVRQVVDQVLDGILPRYLPRIF